MTAAHQHAFHKSNAVHPTTFASFVYIHLSPGCFQTFSYVPQFVSCSVRGAILCFHKKLHAIFCLYICTFFAASIPKIIIKLLLQLRRLDSNNSCLLTCKNIFFCSTLHSECLSVVKKSHWPCLRIGEKIVINE